MELCHRWKAGGPTKPWVKNFENETFWVFLQFFCKYTVSGCFSRLGDLLEISEMAFQTFSAKSAKGLVFDASFSAALPIVNF